MLLLPAAAALHTSPTNRSRAGASSSTNRDLDRRPPRGLCASGDVRRATTRANAVAGAEQRDERQRNVRLVHRSRQRHREVHADRRGADLGGLADQIDEPPHRVPARRILHAPQRLHEGAHALQLLGGDREVVRLGDPSAREALHEPLEE